ncbi:MAG: hypothetical protein ACTS3F_01720 [Phycisphaerales bacterium]
MASAVLGFGVVPMATRFHSDWETTMAPSTTSTSTNIDTPTSTTTKPRAATPARSKSGKAKRKSGGSGRSRRPAPTLGSALSQHIAAGHLNDASPGALRALTVLLAERLVDANAKTPAELDALGIPAKDTCAALGIALRLNKLMLVNRVLTDQIALADRDPTDAEMNAVFLGGGFGPLPGDVSEIDADAMDVEIAG